MRKGKSLIACKIFEHELNEVLSSDTDVAVYWIDSALHANPIRMKKEQLKETSISFSVRRAFCQNPSNPSHYQPLLPAN